MRLRGRVGSSLHINENNSQRFMLIRSLLYVQRLLQHFRKVDYETLETIHWLLGPEIVQEDLAPLVSMLDNGQRGLGFDQDMTEIIHEISRRRDFAHLMDKCLRYITEHEKQCTIDLLIELLNQRSRQLQYSGVSDIEKSLAAFQSLFNLNDVEADICLFLFIQSIYEEAQSLFEYHLNCNRFVGRNHLAVVLGVSGQLITQTLNRKLFKIGIIDSERYNGISLNADFVNLLQTPHDVDIKTEFFKKIDPDPIPLSAHTTDPQIINHVVNLLKQKPLSSTNVLFYGPPGTGKTSLAYGIGKKLGLPIYLIEHGGKEKSWKRRAAFTASANMASHTEGALLIADDSDLILNTQKSWFSFGETPDKKWLHDMLEIPGVRIIWTVNSIERIEESVARRFAYSLSFKPFNRVQRKRVWENILTDYRLDGYFDNPDIEKLASKFDVSAGVIEQAAKKAMEMGSNDKGEIYDAIVLSLEAHNCLINGGRKPILVGKVDPHQYTVEGLNIAGANLNSLLKEIKAFEDLLKRSSHDEPISMSLLFHGVSGAGKSHLARYIAHHLDKEILIKKAGDLLSMWVGETEKNISAAFREANEKDAVLVFDEADFLLGNRDNAVHSWERSQVNEFLTAMESFNGIQIYTTNRLTDLDPATLRRFDHKLEFGFLEPEGVGIFYRKLLLPLVGFELDKKLESELKGVAGLTPGDFKVVHTKFRFKPRGEVSHKSLIKALHEEARVKEVHAGKKAPGF